MNVSVCVCIFLIYQKRVCLCVCVCACLRAYTLLYSVHAVFSCYPTKNPANSMLGPSKCSKQPANQDLVAQHLQLSNRLAGVRNGFVPQGPSSPCSSTCQHWPKVPRIEAKPWRHIRQAKSQATHSPPVSSSEIWIFQCAL